MCGLAGALSFLLAFILTAKVKSDPTANSEAVQQQSPNGQPSSSQQQQQSGSDNNNNNQPSQSNNNAANNPSQQSNNQPPTTALPSKSPTVNTNYCGTTWAYHAQNCATSRPCPRGDECWPGEQYFFDSPCVAMHGPEDLTSNVGSFCGTEWNVLMLMVSSEENK